LCKGLREQEVSWETGVKAESERKRMKEGRRMMECGARMNVLKSDEELMRVTKE
jgi:hypothetical protein